MLCCTHVPARLVKDFGSAMILYGMTSSTAALSVGIFAMYSGVMRELTLAIEWDTVEEVFIVKHPKSIFGGTESKIVQR